MKLAPIITRMFSHVRNSYALDPRSLAVFRIAVALVVLLDLIRRFPMSFTMYSDAGLLPRKDAIPALSQFRWSALFSSGSPEFVNAFFVIGFIAAIAMIFGWKTRLATIVLWVVVVSIQVRNQHLNNGGDTLMRVTLFWSMFLPLARVWSIDSSSGATDQSSRQQARSSLVSSVAAFALILQISSVYLFTAILKSGTRWREEGSALYISLGAQDLSTGPGDWVFHHAPGWILSFLTFGTLLMEFAVPIMLLLPLRSGWLRTFGVLLILSLQLGILVTMTVGLFPAISIASVIGLLPKCFWEKVVVTKPAWLRLPALTGRMDVLPDAFLPAPGQPANLLLNASVTKSKTSRRATSDNQLVHFIHQPGTTPANLKMVAGNLLAALAVMLMMGWNIQSVSSYSMPDALRNATISAGLNQKWSMFAPNPQAASVWYVVEGELTTGEKVDLFAALYSGDVSSRTEVIWDQSASVVNQDKYWRKYFSSIRDKETPMLRFAAYACRTWNAENSGDDRLVRLTFNRGVSRTLQSSERAEPVYTELGSWNCR